MKKDEFITQAMTTVRSDYARALGRADMESAFAAFCEVAAAELLGGGKFPARPWQAEGEGHQRPHRPQSQNRRSD